jgi:hypothetical protein
VISFCLFFNTLSILSILDPLERQSLCGVQKAKNHFLGVKNHFLGVKNHFLGVKNHFYFSVVY